MGEQPTRYKHYAILVGIDAYPEKSLKSCIRDITDIEIYLQTSPNPIHLQILTATEGSSLACPPEGPKLWPTCEDVSSCFERVKSLAKAGDFVYVHFSGHGTTCAPSENPLDVTTGDVALVASKYSAPSMGDLALVLLETTGRTGIRYLRGAELALLVKRLVDKGLIVTLVLDCCFSGSVMRDDSSARYLRYDAQVDAAYPPILDMSTRDEASRTVFRKTSMRSNRLINPDGYTILTACGPTETAEEVAFNGQKRGALSYRLIKTLKDLGHMNCKHLHIYMHLCGSFRKAREQFPHQKIPSPMFYGNKTLGFVGYTAPDIDGVQIPITKQPEGRLQLEAGLAHGICEGDEFAVQPMNLPQKVLLLTRDPMIVKVKQVEGLISDLHVLNMTSTYDERQLVAVTLTRYYLQRFPVQLKLGAPCSESEWARILQKRPSLDIRDADHVEPGSSFSFYATVDGDDCYQIRGESGQIIPNMPPSSNVPNGLVDSILDVVEHLARYKMVKELGDRPSAGSARLFIKSFDVRLINSAGQAFAPGCFEQCNHPDCLIEAEPGEELELVVTNYNIPEGPCLYLHVLNLGSTWEVENILSGNHEVLPPRYSNRHENFQQGTTGVWRKKLESQQPPWTEEAGLLSYEDVIKVFVTSQSTSFMSLELPEIGNVFERDRVRRYRGDDGGSPSEHWAAFNFRIRSRIQELK